MAQASITISDNDNGNIDVAADFGEVYEPQSQAHGMASTLLESVLASAKSYTKVEDTAPDVDVEPSKIIVPENGVIQ